MKQISLFAGVGAFELAAQEVGIDTILSCEIDKHACMVLREHFSNTEVFQDDVRKLQGSDIVSKYGSIDLITAGFPCQSFSIAGKRKGFDDLTRGTLFHEVIRLAKDIKPSYILLENVKGLLNHEKGRTFGIILESLSELGYDVEWMLLNSKDFGVPQNRERVFIVGHTRERSTRQIFPIRYTKREIQKGNRKISIDWVADFRHDEGLRIRKEKICNSLQARARQDGTAGQPLIKVHPCITLICDSGLNRKSQLRNNVAPLRANTGAGHNNKIIQRTHGFNKGGLKDLPSLRTSGMEQNDFLLSNRSIRRLTPIECERLQSFPDNWTLVNNMSDSQRYKQMGNSITVNVLREIYKKIL